MSCVQEQKEYIARRSRYRSESPTVRRFEGVGRCIYCPASEGKLGEEHIIARAFGGLLIMKDASCTDCERITSGLETKCSEVLFGPAKSYFGIKARKSREVPKRIQSYLGDVYPLRKTSVPAEEHPGTIWMLGYVGPGLLVGRDPSQKIGVQIIPIQLHDDWRARLRRLGGAITTRGLDTNLLGRVMAKTAHAYAMAKIPGQFEPCLIPHIRGETDLPLSHYIGRRMEPKGVSDQLHEIELHRETIADGRSFWFVRLRLFATVMNTPIHDVVVGEAIC